MLKQRIITAIILIALFVFLLFNLSIQAFCVLTGLAVFWGSVEWSAFMGIKKFPQSAIYPVCMIFILLGSIFLPINYYSYFLSIVSVWWLVAFLLVLIYPRGSECWGRGISVRAVMGVLVLVPCWLALNFLRDKAHGAWILLFLFILIWGADSAAYFTGKKWGKHKLAPLVSPGKTWQGLAGALVMTCVIAIAALILCKVPYVSWASVILLSLVTVLFSILGDLFESMLKRKAGLKDSGRLLPGHGGLLDRIDSLTAAAPIFALGLLWLPKIYH